jgi:hypothetical protein
MRTLLVLAILQLVALRVDAHLRGEIDEAQLGVAKHEFPGRQANDEVIASQICGWLGGEIGSCYTC